MDEKLTSEIMDRITKVCICKAIPRVTIKKAISNGATTLKEVQMATGAGSGPCGGKRCSVKILELLKQEVEQKG